jgi:membrane associated rhomboid family serine protease
VTIFKGNMFRRIPFLTFFLLMWLVLCFIFEWSIKAFVYPDRIGSFFGISRSIALNGYFLRFVTASFFHMNLGHFISNIFGLIIFLSVLEYAIGAYRALIVVLVSALGGTIGSVVFEWVQFMVGASTILFGVYGALGILIFRYRQELGKYFALIALIWLINLVGSVLAGYISLKIVDQGAHIGGFIAGALVTLCITHGRSLKELQNPISLRMKISLITLVAIFGISFFKEVFVLWPLLLK